MNSAVFSRQSCQYCSAPKSGKQEDFMNNARIHSLYRNIPSSLSLAATVKPVCNTGCDNAHGQIRVTEAFTPSPCVTIRTLSPFASSAIACTQTSNIDTHLEQLFANSTSTMPTASSSSVTLIYGLSSRSQLKYKWMGSIDSGGPRSQPL